MADFSPQLFVSLYTDEDVTTQLAILLRQRGFTAQSAAEVNRLHQPDEAQLSYATSQNMVLFSFNVRDYVLLAQQWAVEKHTHTGILLSDQFARRQIGELLRHTLKFLNTVSADEMVNSILSQFKT